MKGLDHERARLLERARTLGGRTLHELARAQERRLPEDLKRDKGLVGRLIEVALDVPARSGPGPDLPALGVEIKTLPVDARGKPVESTFVCTVHLDRAAEAQWESSALRHKLGCVLFVPVEADRALPLATRRVGSAFFWQPSDVEWRALQADWTELLGHLGHRGPNGLSAHVGECLQVRPKGASAAHRTRGRDAHGAPARVPPRGLYLRARFTHTLLERALTGRTPPLPR